MVEIGETFNGRWDWGVFGRCAYVSLGGKANTHGWELQSWDGKYGVTRKLYKVAPRTLLGAPWRPVPAGINAQCLRAQNVRNSWLHFDILCGIYGIQ